MNIDRATLVDQIIAHEGVRRFPYLDTRGKTSIGVGRNLTDVGISHAEALVLLNDDLDVAITDLAGFGWFRTLDAVRQTALVDLRFNVGGAGFRSFSRMIAALTIGDYAEAARQLQTSAWATEVQPARRDRLVQQLIEGVSM